MIQDQYGHHWGLGTFKVELRDSQLKEIESAQRHLSPEMQQKTIDEMWDYSIPIDQYRGDGVQDVTLTLYVDDVAKVEQLVRKTLKTTTSFTERGHDGKLDRVQLSRGNVAVVVHRATWDTLFSNNRAPVFAGGTSVATYIYVDDMGLALRRIRANGGVVVTKPFTTSWGERAAEVRDSSGHVWMVASRQSGAQYDTAQFSACKKARSCRRSAGDRRGLPLASLASNTSSRFAALPL